MAKDKITDYDTTNANNEDIGGVPVLGSSAISYFDNALRELMTHLAETNAGTYPVADTWSFADPNDLTKIARIDCGSITTSNTRVITMADGNVTLVAGTMVTSSGTATLTNKSLSDSTTSFVDNSDNTKVLKFECSGITTATTRTVTWPDADVTIPSGTIATTTSSITEAACFFIETPDNQDYRLVLDVPFAGTITKVTTRSASGTCTATVKINTTALGGTANSVSSSEQGQAHSTSNTFSAGDDIVLTVSSNSSCADMSLTIKFTRALS